MESPVAEIASGEPPPNRLRAEEDARKAERRATATFFANSPAPEDYWERVNWDDEAESDGSEIRT